LKEARFFGAEDVAVLKASPAHLKEREMSIDDITPEEWTAIGKYRDSTQACPYADPELYTYKNPLHLSKPIEKKEHSDGTSADYYKIPTNAKQLQDLISYKDMNAQMGEIFRAVFRYGEVAHSKKLRDINKIIFYALAEKERLEKYGE